MPTPVVVRCSISTAEGGWQIEVTAPAGISLPRPRRDVSRVGSSPNGFPLPPESEVQALLTADKALLPKLNEDTLRKHYGNCLRG